MNKRLISIFLAVGMVFCLIPASFTADTDSMVTVISNDDFTANPDVCFGYWGNPNEQYSKGQIWGAYYPDIQHWITRTPGTGWEFTQSKNIGSGNTIHLDKLAFLGKSLLSKSDLKSTVGFYTGEKTEIGYNLQFKVSSLSPFEYNSNTGKLILGAPGVSNREVQLEENKEYRLETTYAYNKSAGVYGVNHKIFKADDEGNYTLETERDFPDDSDHLSDVRDIITADNNQIGFGLKANGKYEGENALTYFTLYDIKIENIVWGDIVDIGGIKYSDTGISFEDTGAEVALNPGKYNPSDALNYVTSNDAEWLANNCWGCDDKYYSTNQMKSEDGYLWIKTRTGGEYYPQYGTLSHHFTPVKDGSTLYFTSDIKFPKLGNLTDDGGNEKTYGGMLSLSSLDGAKKLNIFEYSFRIYSGVRFMLGGINQDFAIWGSNEYAKTLDWQQWDQPTLSAPDVLSLSVTLSPSMDDSSKYEANIIIENPSGESPETVIETDEPILLDKDFAESLCKLELSSTREGLYANGNTNRIAGLKNIKFETSNRAKENEGLKAGETSLYIPFNNITKNNFGAALCAAVTDKTTGLQKAFYTAEYDSILPYRGNLKIDLSVSDPAKEYVRVFIFDSFEKLSPLSVSKSTNN